MRQLKVITNQEYTPEKKRRGPRQAIDHPYTTP